MKKFNFLAIVLLLTLILNACGSDTVYQVGILKDQSIPTTLTEVVESSEVIVKGSFGDLLEKVNMIGLADEPSVPAGDLYVEGHVYEFNNEKIYKGNVEGPMKVIIGYATEIEVVNEKGKVVGEVMVEDLEYAVPHADKQYILFLVKNPIGNNMYSRSTVLYQIEIEDDESLQFISKRVEGQLGENIDVTDLHSAEFVTEIRDDISVDIFQEVSIAPDYLEGDNLSDLEQKLKKYER